MIETALDVAFDDPRIGGPPTSAVFGLRSRSHGHADMFQGAMTASAGSEPVGNMPESRLENRLQKVLHRALYNAVTHGRNAQGSEFPGFARLRNEFPAGWTRLIPALPQVVTEVFEERLLSRRRAYAPDCHPVDPSGTAAFVAGNPSPGAAEIAGIGDPVPQVSVTVVRVRPTPLIELADRACVECRGAKPHRLDLPSPRVFPPSWHAYRFPACLCPVRGVPALRLLRRLRPLIQPSPVSADSSGPSPSGRSGFPCSSS